MDRNQKKQYTITLTAEDAEFLERLAQQKMGHPKPEQMIVEYVQCGLADERSRP